MNRRKQLPDGSIEVRVFLPAELARRVTEIAELEQRTVWDTARLLITLGRTVFDRENSEATP